MGPDSQPAVRRLDLGVLDALRGLAALYVLLYHAWGLLWLGGIDPAAYERLTGAGPAFHVNPEVVGRLLRFGQEAVLLFFLLSGFCIHYRQACRARAGGPAGGLGGFQARAFFRRRAARLYPTLLAALALTAVLDAFGSRLYPPLYNGGVAALSQAGWIVPVSYDVPTLLGNLLMQTDLWVHRFGSNGPLWSLAFEWWYYATYPGLLWLMARLGPLRAVRGVAAVSLGAAAILSVAGGPWPLRVAACWAAWAGGALVAEAYAGNVGTRTLRRRGPLALAIGAMLYLGGAQSTGWLEVTAWSLVLGCGLAYLLLCLPPALARQVERCARPLRPLADLSYPLYVTHFPVLLLCAAWWLSGHARLPAGIELGALGLAAALALACAVWHLVEKRSQPPRPAGADRVAAYNRPLDAERGRLALPPVRAA